MARQRGGVRGLCFAGVSQHEGASCCDPSLVRRHRIRLKRRSGLLRQSQRDRDQP